MTSSLSNAGSSSLPPGYEEVLRLMQQNPTLLQNLVQSRTQRTLDRRLPAYQKLLQEQLASLNSKEGFQTGDILFWKQGLKNKRAPLYGEPVIVVEVLETPIRPEREGPGSAYFREPLDLLIGVLDEEDEMQIFHVDSRRFTSRDRGI